MLWRTVQVLIATLLIAFATIGIMWVLGLIDPAAAKTSAYRMGGVFGICLLAALGVVAVFSLGGNKNDR